ncbi:hypothetical protein L484_006930 [Morus notabilis]|uniref:Uncharacterized protein n=1 Tax=Morus notabilis TaxID=981085 RepID=W9QDL4_9ROSA|nr:hypothetical protein L484_006930 [Morus notabilis]
MAAADEVLRLKLPENVEVSGDSPSELHVLAVDDSLVDIKTVAGVDGIQEREENRKEKSEKMKTT